MKKSCNVKKLRTEGYMFALQNYPFMKNEVKIIRFEKYGEIRLGIYFSYDEHLKELAKSIGCYWSPEHRLWHKEDTPSNEKKIKSVFKDYLFETQKQKSLNNRKKNARKLKSQLTFDKKKILSCYKDYLFGQRYSRNTIELYCGMIELFLGYYYSTPIEAIDIKKIERYNEEIIYKGGYSISYHRQFVGAIKLFCKRFDLPLIDHQELIRPAKEYKLPTVLSKEEVMLIVTVTQNVKHKMILLLLYSTGMGISELINLELKDVSIARLQVNIRNGKGRKSRYVGFASKLVPMYQGYLESFRPLKYVIEGKPTYKYTSSSIQKIIKRSAIKAGIKKNVSAHTFRHSYATHLLERGVSLRHIQELLGHESSETTMIYTHISKREAVGISSPLDTITTPDNPHNNYGNFIHISRE